MQNEEISFYKSKSMWKAYSSKHVTLTTSQWKTLVYNNFDVSQCNFKMTPFQKKTFLSRVLIWWRVVNILTFLFKMVLIYRRSLIYFTFCFSYKCFLTSLSNLALRLSCMSWCWICIPLMVFLFLIVCFCRMLK